MHVGHCRVILESKQGISKVALLVLHSILSLLGVFDFEMTKGFYPISTSTCLCLDC